MTHAIDPSARAEVPLLIAFSDLHGYTMHALRTPDAEVAETMDELYRRVANRVEAAGGRVVKFIGDAALMVFPEGAADDGVVALLALKREIEQWLASDGWNARMVVKVHFGTVIAGPFGVGENRRFDVIGRAVNTAARLDSRGFAMSPEAFRKLAPETRKHFKKHTPPVTYIRSEDRHG